MESFNSQTPLTEEDILVTTKLYSDGLKRSLDWIECYNCNDSTTFTGENIVVSINNKSSNNPTGGKSYTFCVEGYVRQIAATIFEEKHPEGTFKFKHTPNQRNLCPFELHITSKEKVEAVYDLLMDLILTSIVSAV